MSEFDINGNGTGGTVSSWPSSGFESEAKYLYLNELNLIFSFSRWKIPIIVTASSTTELIDANMIFGVLLVVSAYGGIGVCAVGINGTQNDSRTENFIPIRIIRNRLDLVKNQNGSRVMWIRLYMSYALIIPWQTSKSCIRSSIQLS